MGFAVLHIQKPKGNDAGTSAHIERKVVPDNADLTRVHLNKEFIDFPEGVENRTQAIQYRIANANIGRKIRHDQVRALQVMLSGTPEDMQLIQQTGKLNEWCNDNIEWLQNTFGKDNLVSAVLHMDEKIPHIHATVVPIVSGERRKAKETDPAKKKYKTKKNRNRLCADDVMARDKLIGYQDSYAEKMKKFGLEPGINGSEARHISTPQYYRDLYVQNEELRENIGFLQEEKQEVYDKVRDLYDRKDEARDKFIAMDNYISDKQKEIDFVEKKLQIAEQKYEPYKGQEDINLLCSIFPVLTERLRIAKLCKATGLGIDSIKSLFKGEPVSVNGSLYSPEHKQSFPVKDASLKIFKDKENPDKLKLSINGKDILDWFKQKYQEFKQKIGVHVKQNIKSKSRGL